jgi:hypothetical protein|tara:strand:- start:1251 stop:2429 length:1179 start_codon:yes stop_codon:yes gene_type:complete
MSEEIKETSNGELTQGEFKIKKKPKKFVSETKITKIDLSKKEDKTKEPIEDLVKQEEETNKEVVEAKVEEVLDSTDTKIEETKIEETKLEEIKQEEAKDLEETKDIVEDIKEEIKVNPEIELPENVDKLVSFMKETGGTVEDFVKLNRDLSKLNNEQILLEYYKSSKPHLNAEEVEFLMDDNFAWDEDEEERSVKKKKLAFKEEIAKAKTFLEKTKSKYYDEIKLRPGVTQEQQKANDFLNKYNKEQELIKHRVKSFTESTNKFFSNEFKGFEYNVGEKSFRYNVNDPNGVANSQSNLNNFVGKFLDQKGEIKDFKGYHKALYTAENADSVAKHFYEQGKTDAIRDITAKSKNINNEIRATSSGEMFINGLKVKAISGVDSSKLKIKTNKYK